MNRAAFTMIELIFVIVVIGILASVAIPKLAANRDDAQLVRGRSDVAAIRAAVVNERQVRLLQGNTKFINQLDDAAQNKDGETLFDNNGTTANGLLQYGIISGSGNGHWLKTGNTSYAYNIMGQQIPFTYTQSSGTFTCNRTANGTGTLCQKLVD